MTMVAYHASPSLSVRPGLDTQQEAEAEAGGQWPTANFRSPRLQNLKTFTTLKFFIHPWDLELQGWFGPVAPKKVLLPTALVDLNLHIPLEIFCGFGSRSR